MTRFRLAMADNSSSNVSLSVPPSLNLFLLQMKWEKMSELMSSMQRVYKHFAITFLYCRIQTSFYLQVFI